VTLLHRLMSILRWWLRRQKAERDLNDELQTFVEMAAADHVRDGSTPAEARRQAILELGGLEQAKERVRTGRHGAWLDSLGQDVRYGLRQVRRSPGFSAIAIATLALGLGLTTAIFGVFNAVLLRPLSYPNPERLMWIATRDARAPFPMETVLAPDFLAWKAQATSFEHVVAYDLSDEPIIVDGDATRERVASVSTGFWELAGVRLTHGRLPAQDERDMVLVSHGFFQARLGGDATSIGKVVRIAGRPVTIIGVLPPTFLVHLPWPTWPGFEPEDVTAFQTMYVDPPVGNQIRLLNVVGKLRAGVTIEQARAELQTIGARLAQANPAYPGSRMTLRLVPLAEHLAGHSRLALHLLLSAVLLVLLMACANVASLLFARGAARQKEIAIRAAVGAGRGRLVRQLLVESLMLGAGGGVAGLVVAYWSLSLILGAVPDAIPRLMESSIDGSVLAFGLVATLVTAFAFGVGPAFALRGVHLQHALNLGSRPSSVGSMNPRARGSLVAAEMAFAVVLLTGAGLLIKSFGQLTAHPAGFEPAQVLTMKVEFSGRQYREESRRREYIEAFLRRTQSLPGVSAAGISTFGDIRSAALVEGAPVPPRNELMQRSSVLLNSVSEGAAGALGLRVIQGRWLSDAESSYNVVVNESLARRDFHQQDAVGRRIHLNSAEAPVATIVGVVADLKYNALEKRIEPEVYVHYSRGAPGRFTALIRTTLDPMALAPAIARSASDIDRSLPVFDVQTLERALADSIAPRRLNLFLLGTFAAAALGLALTGIYGVVTYSVTQRTHELGVRMALGATRRDIVAFVVRQGVGMALVGIVIGVVAAMLLTRLMVGLLYNVEPTDPQTLVGAVVGLMLTASVASLIPALRAARIDPVVTLR
jgi:putative ABC transport system permease protein